MKTIRNIVIGTVLLSIVFVGIGVVYANYEEKKTNPFDYERLSEFVYKYREFKSLTWAQSDEKWPSVVGKQFWHRKFDGFRSGDHVMQYIIISNDYEITSIKKIDSNYLKDLYGEAYNELKSHLRGKYENNSYNIEGKEFFLGKIESGKVVYFKEPKVYTGSYDVCIEESELKIIDENMYNDYYILEKDVPILLNRLNLQVGGTSVLRESKYISKGI